MPRWLRDNSLTIALATLFLFSVVGQALTGWQAENAERAMHHLGGLGLPAYLASGAFLSALFENWESEFLQMWAYVMLTAYLFQRGSPESRDPDKPAPVAPRAGGLARAVYSHSLGLALLALFVAAFVLHWLNSARMAAEEALAHGEVPAGVVARLADPEFWFESFQNWQSEFLSTAVLIVLAIFLRERGSPESKPVDAPHGATGTD